MRDGMADSELRATDMTATNLSGTNFAAGATQVGKAETALDFAPVATGSPTAYGNSIQYGSATTSAGSIKWVVFGTAFAAAPNVALTAIGETAGGTSVVGSPVGIGSFLAVSEKASQLFNWIGCGSGRV